MNNERKRLVLIFIIILLFIASVMVYAYLIRGSYDDAVLLRNKLATKDHDIEYYKNTTEKMQEMLDEFQNSESIRTQVPLMFPGKLDVGHFSNQVIELARINNLNIKQFATKINSIVASKISGVRGIGSITANVSFTGSYAGMKAFVSQLENNMLIMNVESIKINKSSGTSDIDYVLTVTSYYQAK